MPAVVSAVPIPWRSKIPSTRAGRRIDVDQVHVLVGCHAVGDPELGGDLAQRRAEGAAGVVRNASGDHAQPQEPAAVALRMPAQPVIEAGPFDRSGRLDRDPHHLRDLVAEPVDAPVVDQVLETGVAPIGPVAVVTLDPDHAFGYGQQVVGPHEAERIGQARERLGLAVGSAESPPTYTFQPSSWSVASRIGRCPGRG